jgi:thiamine pyrophosphate-dependent acetolactate synthase large subunit-like protein
MTITHREALEVLARHRGDAIVITTMTAVGLWPELSDSPRDFAYMPSAMSQAPALGLGLALARPGQQVIVVNGDGSMLMNLGSLVTLAANPAQVFLVIMDNGIYEVTGGQATAGAGQVDFAAMARAAGIPRVYYFSTLAEWEQGAPDALGGVGPVVICLRVEARLGLKTPKPPRPMAEQIQRLREALGDRPR